MECMVSVKWQSALYRTAGGGGGGGSGRRDGASEEVFDCRAVMEGSQSLKGGVHVLHSSCCGKKEGWREARQQ